LCIDYYALRSRQFQFVLDLFAFYDNTPASHPQHHVAALPNFVFSRALAAWQLEAAAASGATSAAAAGMRVVYADGIV
jgi:hypothetical protein